jgi:hypothetical protein
LNVPVPAHGEGEGELWIAELGLVGELVKRGNGTVGFNRGVSIYPTLGDRVRVASRVELEQASTTISAIPCGSAASARIPPSPP